jgi:hypothetical protein
MNCLLLLFLRRDKFTSLQCNKSDKPLWLTLISSTFTGKLFGIVAVVSALAVLIDVEAGGEI